MVRLEYLHSLEGGMLNKVDGKNVVDCLKKAGYDFVKVSIAKEIYNKAVKGPFPCGCHWSENQNCEKCKIDYMRAEIYWFYEDNHYLGDKSDNDLFVIPCFGEFYLINLASYTSYKENFQDSIQSYKKKADDITDDEIEAMIFGREGAIQFFYETFKYFCVFEKGRIKYEAHPDFFQKQNEMIRSVFFTTKNRSEQCV